MEGLKSSSAHTDPEKAAADIDVTTDSASSNDVQIHVPEKLSRWNRAIESMRGLEARGISRVPPHKREAPSFASYVQMVVMWYSANITLNNLAVGFLGPLLFHLGFLDSAIIVVFACLVGTLGPAYMSIFGPESGNRTMVRDLLMRYQDKSRLYESRSLRGILWATGLRSSLRFSTSFSWSVTARSAIS